MMLVSLNIYDIFLNCNVRCRLYLLCVIWGKVNVYGLFASYIGLCGVMGVHIQIALIDLDWGYE